MRALTVLTVTGMLATSFYLLYNGFAHNSLLSVVMGAVSLGLAILVYFEAKKDPENW